MAQRRTLRIVLALLLLVTGCGGGSGGDPGDSLGCPPPPSGSAMTPSEESLAAGVLALVNQERAAALVGSVAWHGPMAQASYEHSWDMFTRGYFSHTNPCGEGPAERLARAGIAWTALGENIAYGPPTAALVMAMWMNSAGHRANILDPRFTRCAIGVYASSVGPYWTMMLIRE